MTAALKLDLNLNEIKTKIHKPWQSKVKLFDINGLEVSTESSHNLIGIAPTLDPGKVLDLAIDKKLQHFCHTLNFRFESDLNTATKMVIEPEAFAKYPMSTILNPQKASSKEERKNISCEWNFHKATEKIAILDSVEAYCSKLNKTQTLLSEIRGVVDELFTNAVYNAPFVDLKTHINPNVDRRDQSISMTDGKSGRIFLGHDDSRLIIGCQDPYGTLDIHKLLKRIRDCYRGGIANSMNMGKGGAGIGSYMVYNSSSSYYAAVVFGKTTIVCCAIPLKMSGKSRSIVPRNLNFIQL